MVALVVVKVAVVDGRLLSLREGFNVVPWAGPA